MSPTTEPQVLVVPLSLLIGLIGPMYGLITIAIIMLFKHSTNDDRHLDAKNPPVVTALCDQTKEANQNEHAQIRKRISSVDKLGIKAVEAMQTAITSNFNRLFEVLANKN